MTKVTIELTKEQALVIMDALELYSRIYMGQFDEIEHRLHLDTYDKALNRPDYDRELARICLDDAQRAIFYDLNPGAYVGIQATNENSKISWDIYQQIRHDLSWHDNPGAPFEERGNSFDKPLVTSKQPLPKVIIKEE